MLRVDDVRYAEDDMHAALERMNDVMREGSGKKVGNGKSIPPPMNVGEIEVAPTSRDYGSAE